MNISLAPDLERIVRQKVERGEYESADALVGEAVQRLIDEQKEEDANREEIRSRIAAAESEIERGEYVEYDESNVRELARDIQRRGRKRLAAERKKTG